GQLVQRRLVQLAGIQQRLRRDAADVQARAAEGLVRALLDARHLQPELRGADRRRVPARTAADHHEVVALRHYWPSRQFTTKDTKHTKEACLRSVQSHLSSFVCFVSFVVNSTRFLTGCVPGVPRTP